MKKFISTVLFIYASIIYPQGWNNVVTTNISEADLVKMELFTNKDGNHILLTSTQNNIVKYVLLNSSGSTMRQMTIDTGGYFPNITGNDNDLYIVYKKGSNLKVMKSTNAGENWSSLEDIQMTYQYSNGVDAVFDSKGLHVVWSERPQQNDPNYYETYYKRYFDNRWRDYANVTNYTENEVGGFPTVTTSANKVHVSYNTGPGSLPHLNLGDAKTRDYNFQTQSWEAPQLVYGVPNGYSMIEKVFARSDSLFLFYYKNVYDLGQYWMDLYVTKRAINGTNWSSSQLLQTRADGTNLLGVITTNNGILHIVYPSFYGIKYRYYDGNNWSSEQTISTGNYYNYKSPYIYSKSNDLYVIWKDEGSNYIKYRQYDAAPLAPQNLSVTIVSGKPKLSWTLNNEPDVRVNSGGYRIERRLDQAGNGQWTNWTEIGSRSGTQDTLIDFNITTAGSGPSRAQYRIRARDIGGNNSAYSSVVEIQYGNGLDKTIVKKYDYHLSDNYPNPFNPVTRIRYSIQKSTFTTLKVYDLLGEVVATLVNEPKQAGEYEIEFNADNYGLKSGVYFYELKTSDFRETKKFILLK
ncbi:MAG: T9SS type A sorting domain-containing protein [Ignavibacteria bacterium]